MYIHVCSVIKQKTHLSACNTYFDKLFMDNEKNMMRVYEIFFNRDH